MSGFVRKPSTSLFAPRRGRVVLNVLIALSILVACCLVWFPLRMVYHISDSVARSNEPTTRNIVENVSQLPPPDSSNDIPGDTNNESRIPDHSTDLAVDEPQPDKETTFPNGRIWPPRDVSTTSLRPCNWSHYPHAVNQDDAQVRDIVNFRHKQKLTWHEQSCKRWKLGGEWRPRDRKIYYATLVDSEMPLLTVLLEEIYDVVDHIILQESSMSWRYHKKPMYFTKFKESHFKRYAPKIRHLVYDFDTLANASNGECPRTSDPRVDSKDGMNTHTDTNTKCPWWQQWHSRNHLATGAIDMGPDDIFIVADLDEVVSREFLVALKHCDVLPEIETSGKCKRLGIFTFGHKFYFDCSVLKEAGHFHPDLTLGRCLNAYGPEELRLHWGDMHPVKPGYYTSVKKQVMPRYNSIPDGFLKPDMVGPAGWHMHSFGSTAHAMYKFFTRAGKSLETFDESMFNTIRSKRVECNERRDFFKLDALSCQPLPHAVLENPQAWRHVREYTPDEHLPDEFGSLRQVQALLALRKVDSTATPGFGPRGGADKGLRRSSGIMNTMLSGAR